MTDTSKTSTPVPASPAPVRAVPKVQPKPECAMSELRAAASVRHEFFHEVPHGISLEDVMRPGYWKTVWRQIARAKYTRIECVAIDGTWEATLRVVATGDGFAKTRVIAQWQAERKASRRTGLPDGFEVDYRANGWRVRNADGELITEGHPTEDEAINAAAKLVKKMTG